MEKTFTNAVILSATVMTAFMVFTPLKHLSAEGGAVLDEKTRIRKVVVEDVDFKTNTLVVDIDGTSVPVTTNASTTVFMGNGDETQLPSLRPGTNIYLFGHYNAETKQIEAEKMVIRNKRITERTSLSRAELRAQGTADASQNSASFITLGK